MGLAGLAGIPGVSGIVPGVSGVVPSPVALPNFFDPWWVNSALVTKTGSDYSLSFNFEQDKKTSGNVYWVGPAGVGTSPATQASPARLSAVLDLQNADVIYFLPGFYTATQGWGGRTAGNVTCICPNGVATISRQAGALTWTKSGNVWSATNPVPSLNIGRVFSRTTNEVLAPAASAAAVASTPGTWFYNTTTKLLSVRMLGDSNASDATVGAMLAYANAGLTGNCHLENINFEGGASPLRLSGGRFSLINVSVSHGESDGLVAVNADVFANNCIVRNNGSDGIDYRGGTAIELNCQATRNGDSPSAGGFNNGSTAHEGAKVLRINGTYTGNANRNVHDVANLVGSVTQSVNIACVAGDSRVSPGDVSDAAWAFGFNYAANARGTVLAALVDCTAVDAHIPLARYSGECSEVLQPGSIVLPETEFTI